MKATFTHLNHDFSFTDKDVVNPADFIPKGEFNPHNIRPWLVHDSGFTIAVVFASCEPDALDEAADAGKLDRFLVEPGELADYGEDAEGISYLGNANEAFDIQSVGILELSSVPFSFAAMFMAAEKDRPIQNASERHGCWTMGKRTAV